MKTAVITGGARGLGLVFMKHLLKNGVQNITFTDVDNDEGKKTFEKLSREYASSNLCFVNCDMSNGEHVRTVFETVRKRYDKPDLVINNAGICNDENTADTIESNINGTVNGTTAAIKYMSPESGGNGGTIINIASVLGLQPFALYPVYVGTKHFIVGYVKSFCFDKSLIQRNIKLMALCPGISTPHYLETKGEYYKMDLKYQESALVVESLTKIINIGKTGDIWVSEHGTLYKIQSEFRKFKKKEFKFIKFQVSHAEQSN